MPAKKTTTPSNPLSDTKTRFAVSIYRKNGLWAADLITMENGEITKIETLPEDSKHVVSVKATNWINKVTEIY